MSWTKRAAWTKFRFDQVPWAITGNDEAQRWQDVLDALNGGAMPPKDAKQPESEELARTLDVLTVALQEARRRLTDHGGEIKMRRLNRREYSATIRDLFGFDVALEDIPEDGEIASFDTVGAEQFFSSAHFEKYLELGKQIAMESFRFNLSPPREVTTERTEVETRVTQPMRDNLADLDKKLAMKQAGASWKEMGFEDEGEMEIIFRQWDSRAEMPRRYLQYPFVEKGAYIATSPNGFPQRAISTSEVNTLCEFTVASMASHINFDTLFVFGTVIRLVARSNSMAHRRIRKAWRCDFVSQWAGFTLQ